ncbi:MAG: ABC transporter permease [Candidatus Eisenbacteria bacterium]|uniref:ABC transporter permease n=1 Tax=Eiseniibacteriota bacterium TaxID=2212470 RepID=A0A956SFJ2_UNCEI|nr:ABC transporter permease [Candidatus Eisenbacteria bacterium]
MRYLLGRLGFYLIAAWIAVTMNFFLPRLMPGDPASALFARFRGRLGPEAMDALRETFGLTDAPLLSQYFTYLKHVLQGDLGISVAYFPSPVTDVIASGLVWTVFLAGSAVLISFTIGTLLGIASAWWRRSWLDSWLPPVLVFLGAFPYFWLAMVVLYALGFVRGWFPLGHAYGDDLTPGFTWLFVSDVVRHAALPIGTVVLCTLGGWLLSMRNTMITVLGSDYVNLARAKGLPPARVIFRYAARNALLPNVTGFGMALGFVLGGSLLTEIVFSYPGQGYLFVQAVRNQDYPLMQGVFLIITLSVLAANWLVDMLYLWLDPRTRSAES